VSLLSVDVDRNVLFVLRQGADVSLDKFVQDTPRQLLSGAHESVEQAEAPNVGNGHHSVDELQGAPQQATEGAHQAEVQPLALDSDSFVDLLVVFGLEASAFVQIALFLDGLPVRVDLVEGVVLQSGGHVVLDDLLELLDHLLIILQLFLVIAEGFLELVPLSLVVFDKITVRVESVVRCDLQHDS